ncbi:MAG: oligosaccharide flippase family protein [Hungatella sp.]|nr:oligosaccharide flippase family protein [Hungatella sp.]
MKEEFDMNKKNTIKNIAEVALSNCITIFSGAIVGFLIPKILTVHGYGMYKTFTLYTSYVGFCGLGIIDGIVLQYGDKELYELERPLFISYFKWYTFVNAFFVFFLLFLAYVSNDKDYTFILAMLGINVFAINYAGYYQQISQITQRFKEYSTRKIIQCLFNIIITVLLFCLYLKQGTVNYRYYIVCISGINVIVAIWYLYTYRIITLGKGAGCYNTFHNVMSLIKQGFPLLFSNLSSTLILALDRQYVNVLFDMETYAIYAFAYNMLALVTVALSAVSIVIYPVLKRVTNDILHKYYTELIAIILIIVFGAISLYYPLYAFINWFLPEYADSLIIFRIIFPGVAMSSAVTVIMHNYYKTLGKSIDYFKKSIIVLFVSAVTNGAAYVIYKTTISISIASIFTMLFWYIYAEQYFVNYFQYDRKKNILYILIMSGGFYMISFYVISAFGFILYLAYFFTVTYLFYKKNFHIFNQVLCSQR